MEIVLEQIPVAGVGGASTMAPIRGRVKGAKPGQRVVLYAKSGLWWVQPFGNRMFTEIRSDGSWQNETHLGSDYAALLVEPGYVAPKKAADLPQEGNGVVVLVTQAGRKDSTPVPSPSVPLHFSGYEWEVNQRPTDSAGVMFENRASNVNVDDKGRLHLRIAREGSRWTCAELQLKRSLGYGTYSFQFQELPVFEPPTVLSLLTWDDRADSQNHRELDIELSQWGDGAAKDAQFVVQPYYVPANSFRFQRGIEAQEHRFRWEPGRVVFESVNRRGNHVLARQAFTSGIPTPGEETVHIKFNLFGKSRIEQKNPAEVVLEKFAFLP